MNQKQISEIIELASAVCDERATTEQIQLLELRLSESEEARNVYADYMLIHAELYWQQESLQSNVGMTTALLKQPARNSIFNNSWALATMLLIGTMLGAWLVWNLNSQNQQTNIKRAIAGKALGETVAVVSQTVNCRWTIEQDLQTEQTVYQIGYGSELRAGQKLNLQQGAAEITFNSGVKIILEAPASLDLSSGSESILHEGRLTASVPQGAEGFQVACNGITLVDRGTEFGVSAEPSGETEVHVFDGLVEGHVKDAAGLTFKKVSWTTNDMALFNPATSEFRDVAEPSTFIRSLGQTAQRTPGLIASEEFDYPVGRLGGQNGGYGWGGPWEDISVEEGVANSNGIGGGSLPYDSVEHIGNHALLNGQFNRIRRNLSTSFSGVFDTAGMIENQDGARLVGRDGAVLYIGFIQRISKVDDVFYGFELNRGDGNRNRVLCVGHGAARAWNVGPPRSPNKSAGVTRWSVTSEFNGPENQLLELGELGAETTESTLLVLKIEFGSNNNDRVSIYLNPTSLEDESANEPTVVGFGNFAFDRIGIANFEGDKTFEVDNVRLGTDFSAVASNRTASDTFSPSTNR